jgi:quercetin dioxygenase-like cupin family protein
MVQVVSDFVIEDWNLEPYDGDQVPPHLHFEGEEAFVCISGDLEVMADGVRRRVPPGGHAMIPRGVPHTFASREGARVLAVMSPEIAELIDGLHKATTEEERAALWSRARSALA